MTMEQGRLDFIIEEWICKVQHEVSSRFIAKSKGEGNETQPNVRGFD